MAAMMEALTRPGKHSRRVDVMNLLRVAEIWKNDAAVYF
jgi:hypothetical protein